MEAHHRHCRLDFDEFFASNADEIGETHRQRMVMRDIFKASEVDRRGIRVALMAGSALLVVSAIVFTTASAAERAATDGRVTAAAEETLGANDVALKAVAQAVLLAEDLTFGVADLASVEAAEAEARRRLGRLDVAGSHLAQLSGESDVGEATAQAVAMGESLLDRLEAGSLAEATAILSGDFRSSLEDVRDRAEDLRDRSSDALASTTGVAATTAGVTTFLVALILPVALVIAYRAAVRRQLALAEARLDARLAAEEEVLRAKDEFIAGMSHELRTPLTSIYGFSELLLDMGLVDPDSAMDLIGLINSESAELGRMVEDLLVSARAETGALVFTMEQLDVAAELAAVLGSIDPRGKRVGSDIPQLEVWGDRVRVRQILRSLLSNALNHGGEEVFVTARSIVGRVVEITIADDGPGVDEAMVPRLFTRFVHHGADALTEGSVGLGLFAARVLAVGMGGDIEYARTDGLTRFVVTLPSAPRPESSSHDLAAGQQITATAMPTPGAT